MGTRYSGRPRELYIIGFKSTAPLLYDYCLSSDTFGSLYLSLLNKEIHQCIVTSGPFAEIMVSWSIVSSRHYNSVKKNNHNFY